VPRQPTVQIIPKANKVENLEEEEELMEFDKKPFIQLIDQ